MVTSPTTNPAADVWHLPVDECTASLRLTADAENIEVKLGESGLETME